MLVHLAQHDITEMAVDAIVNPANSLGIMGGGVAIQMTQDHPEFVERLILMAPGCIEELDVYFAMPGIADMRSSFGSPDFDLAAQRLVDLAQLDQFAVVARGRRPVGCLMDTGERALDPFEGPYRAFVCHDVRLAWRTRSASVSRGGRDSRRLRDGAFRRGDAVRAETALHAASATCASIVTPRRLRTAPKMAARLSMLVATSAFSRPSHFNWMASPCRCRSTASEYFSSL